MIFFLGGGAKKIMIKPRRKKENMRNVRKTNGRRILRNDSCRALADVSSSIEVAEQIFGSVEENGRDTPVDSISMLSLLLRN